ncbi:MAG TPA: hypothetical protein VGR98_03035, partial [Streptosporangiaceae bacterium]|nr:hypothetical protein [Streptosporangiaceae bacterium]
MTGPDNPFAVLSGYELRNLAAHLEAAGEAAMLHRVLDTATSAGRNAWYEVHFALDDPGDYAADVQRAWRLAEAQSARECPAGRPAQALGLQARYALIAASLNSRAQHLPSELLVAALERGLWSPRRAIAYISQLRSPAARAGALAAIAPHVPEPSRGDALRDMIAAMSADGAPAPGLFAGLPPDLPGPTADQALTIARSLGDAESRALALHALASRHPEGSRPRILREALDAARGIPAATRRLEVLSELLPSLPESLREDAVAAAVAAAGADLDREPAGDRAWPLLRMAAFLTEPQLREALTTIRSVSSWEDRTRLTAGLAPHLTARLLDEALEYARSARSKQERVRTLAALSPHFPARQRERIQDEALGQARALRIDLGRPGALAAVACAMPPPRREAVVDEALEALSRHPSSAAAPLTELAPHLSPRQLAAALRVARSIGESSPRLEALTALSRHAPPRLRGAAIQSELSAARDLWPPFAVRALAGLLPGLQPATRARIVREAVERIWSVPSYEHRLKALAALAPHLTDELLREVINQAQRIDDGGPRSLLLLSLAPHIAAPLEDDEMRRAITVASGRRNFTDRVPILARLAPHLHGELFEAALGAVEGDPGREYGDVDSSKAQVIEALAPRLPGKELQRALELAFTIDSLAERRRGLAALAPYLPETLMERALDDARTIGHGGRWKYGLHGDQASYLALTLAGLAPHVAEPARAAVYAEALAAGRGIGWPLRRADTLAGLLPHLPAEQVGHVGGELLDTLPGLESAQRTTDILRDVAPYLPESLHQRALEAALTIGPDTDRVRALGMLAPRLAQPMRDGALREMHEVACRADDRPYKLADLADVLTLAEGPWRDQLRQEALATARALDCRMAGTDDAVATLVPHLAAADRNEVLDRALAAARSTERCEAMLRLVPLLPASAQPGVLREALAIALSRRHTLDPNRPLDVTLPAVTHLPRDALNELWTWVLRQLASGSRPMFFQRLCD